MATFADKINAEIASHKAAITTLEAELAKGESWLGKEADALWGWIGHLFSHPATAPAAAIVAANPPPAPKTADVPAAPVAAAPTPPAA